MRAVDTNVLVRLITADDAAQLAVAEQFVAGGAWVSIPVVMETMWVLEEGYELDTTGLCNALEMLLKNQTLVLQDRAVVANALATFRDRPALGFTDSLILATARQAGHVPLGTFDRKLSKLDGAQLITGGSRSV
jgi:predicted nucleic-acid-binding protein